MSETASQKTEEEEISDHAYIPYKYAHNCIAKIMEDMKNMKVTHVRIVSEIQGEYKQIEDETQVSNHNLLQCNLPNRTPEYSNILLEPTHFHDPKICPFMQKKHEYSNGVSDNTGYAV